MKLYETWIAYNAQHQNVLLKYMYSSSNTRVSTVHRRRIHKVESGGILKLYRHRVIAYKGSQSTVKFWWMGYGRNF